MESNPDSVICTHDMRYIDAKGNKVREWTHQKGKFNLDYLYLNLPFFAHSSKMFRNDFIFDYFDSLHRLCCINIQKLSSPQSIQI
ncbi:hypothetical protein [Acinetobacter sp. SWBY1]|uniref:hypothetical protein n=1 Tax=Acinetobacter sp. SWBY1 TaxID=2079596 RepID=UPI003A4C6ABF